jgi:AcrR family transcriptional regulator
VSLKPSQSASSHAATRQLLIEAAAHVFAERGFKAASVREICARAGANVAAVNYHFGDKESLYEEVLKYALRCAREKYPPDMGLQPGASWEERLRAFIHSFLLRIFDEGPQACHGKLLSREMIEPTNALDSLVDEEMRPMSQQLQGIIRGLLGVDAPEEAVRRSSMSVISQIVFYHHCRPVTQRLYPKLQFGAKEIDRLADHITEFSLAALKQMSKHIRKK